MRPVGASQYSVTRSSGEGSYVEGLWVSSGTTTLNIVASIQPLSGNELQSLPEGLRTKRPVSVWTQTVLKTVEDDSEGDVLMYEGREYEIQLTKTHNKNAPIPHCHFIAVRKKA